jgi:hypothetical protein
MEDCAICLDTIDEQEKCTNSCGHSFCKSCLDNLFDVEKYECPLCRQKIKYFDHNNINYRLIIKKRNVLSSDTSTINQHNRNRLLNTQGNTIPINKKLFAAIKLLLYGSALYSFIQFYLISGLNDNIKYYDHKLKECEHNNTHLDTVIRENHYFDETNYDDYLIFDKQIDMLRLCYLPVDFMSKCFT